MDQRATVRRAESVALWCHWTFVLHVTQRSRVARRARLVVVEVTEALVWSYLPEASHSIVLHDWSRSSRQV